MVSLIRKRDLDAEKLKILMRCDPQRIQAEEATPVAIETCRMMGVELLLAHGKPAKKCDCGGECHADAGHANRLGVRVVIGQCNPSGFKKGSPEEAEKILANTRIKIRLNPDGLGGFVHAGNDAEKNSDEH